MERLSIKWEGVFKNDVEELGGSDWKLRATDWDEWKASCISR